MPLRFGQFVFDTESHQLWKAGMPARVSPKAFRLLEILIEHRPAVVSKQQLLDKVWEGQIVEEENVKNLIAELRRVLDDDSDDQPIIRTVHRLGYAFAADASDARPRAKSTGWSLSDGQAMFEVGAVTIIGRSAECDVRLQSDSVSRAHARITIDGSTPVIEDLGSKNGTKVAGKRIESPTRLANGDVIRIGVISLTIFSDELRSTRTIPPA